MLNPAAPAPARYVITREPSRILPNGRPGLRLYQVVDTQTGARSIPAALSACERRAAQLNAQVAS